MKNYMLVVHYHSTDRIVNMYFKTKKEMDDALKVVKTNKVEILHKLKIKEVE